METVFPSDPGFEGLFSVGWHKAGGGAITRAGTVIVKRTYDISADAVDPAQGDVTPAAAPLPLFLQDQPESLVLNGNFEAGVAEWQPAAGVTIAQGVDGDDNHFLAVSGAAGGRVTQTVELDHPLRGRRFVFSFRARADAATSVANVRLEAGGQSICSLSEPLGGGWTDFVEEGIWPNTVGATSFQVVLRAAAGAGPTVFYADVAVSYIGYEHDLMPHKPQGDLIVLPTANLVPEAARVNGVPWLRLPVTESGTLHFFGWEARDSAERKPLAPFPEDPGAYPLNPPLPAGYDNRYCNGYRRAAATEAGLSALGYLPSAARIVIERSGVDDYGFTLAGETLGAEYFFFSGVGPDQESRWQARGVGMNLDTLVIEPDLDRCYTVWRGVWEFDDHPQDAYRRLVVTAG